MDDPRDRSSGHLEDRISYYEQPHHDPGALRPGDWAVLAVTGLALPLACLVLGWLLG